MIYLSYDQSNTSSYPFVPRPYAPIYDQPYISLPLTQLHDFFIPKYVSFMHPFSDPTM